VYKQVLTTDTKISKKRYVREGYGTFNVNKKLKMGSENIKGKEEKKRGGGILDLVGSTQGCRNANTVYFLSHLQREKDLRRVHEQDTHVPVYTLVDEAAYIQARQLPCHLNTAKRNSCLLVDAFYCTENRVEVGLFY
jgi:hypothetical protein